MFWPNSSAAWNTMGSVVHICQKIPRSPHSMDRPSTAVGRWRAERAARFPTTPSPESALKTGYTPNPPAAAGRGERDL